MKEDPSFLGTGWAFPPSFSHNKAGATMVSGEEDIRESLTILLSTTIGERLLNPSYGCDLNIYIFEPMDASFSAQIKDVVETAILYHEPRIELENLNTVQDQLQGRLLLEIDYRIRATNTRRNFVYPFYKDEGTDVRL